MAKRGYGTGQLYLKHGAYYGRWRTLDGRKLNRKIGDARGDTGTGGLNRPKPSASSASSRRPRSADPFAPARSATRSTR